MKPSSPRGLNAGLRRLIVAAFVHHAGEEHDEAKFAGLKEAPAREIGRLAFKVETEGERDAELTEAVRNALMILLNTAERDAKGHLAGNNSSLQ